MTASVPSAGGVAGAQSAFARTLLDELVRAGVTDAVLCPGSRSTPLVLALAAEPRVTVHVRLDERSAGFFAIGRALATARPVLVVVTSGTAAAELLPAIVEADLSAVPLVVVTADRPPEVRGTGAPQTIDQVKLFGGAVRRFEDPGAVRPESSGTWRPLASRLVAAAVERAGPVHLNLPLVEPLDAAPSTVPPGRTDGRPWRVGHAAATRPSWRPAGPGILVVGRGTGADPQVVLDASSHLGWPVLADPLSGVRREHPNVVAASDALLRDAAIASALAPNEVVLLGALPASKSLAEALVGWDVPVTLVAPPGSARDPLGVVTDVIGATPASWCAAVLESSPRLDEAYLARWQRAERAAQRTFDELLGEELSEPSLARLVSRCHGDAPLVVSNSMPVRDLEWFGAISTGSVVANRGANGIDGVVSTALGMAAGSRAVALLGDLAFLHDVGALADGLGAAGGTCVLVVADNRGGGIFSFLPQRTTVEPATFERAFATPPRVDLVAVASGFGLEVTAAKDLATVESALAAGPAASGVSVVVAAVPERDANVELHRRLAAAAAEAARAALEG